jgi:hypothetical protein
LSSLVGQNSTSLGVLGLLHQSELTELLKNMTVDLASAEGEMAWSTSKSLRTTENLSQSTNTNVRSDVDSARDGGGSGVHPISVIRGEFLEGGGLDDVSPLRSDFKKNVELTSTYLWDLELALSLQVLGVRLDEFLS